MQRKKKEIS